MIIENKYNSNIYSQLINKNIDSKKIEISAETEKIDTTQAVIKNSEANLSLSDFYKNKTFSTEEDKVNKSFMDLKSIMKEGKPSMSDINDFLNTTQAQLTKETNKQSNSAMSMNAFQEMIDIANKMKVTNQGDQTDKYSKINSDIYKKHEAYMSTIMSTHNLMDSIIKQRG